MTTLAMNKNRTFEVLGDQRPQDIPAAVDVIYAGAAVGEDASTGVGRPLVAGDVFLGFAIAKVDNSGGAAGDDFIRVIQHGTVKLPVTGVVGIEDLGATVYASDDDTFTLTAGSNTAIGKITHHEAGTTVMVAFEAEQMRSL